MRFSALIFLSILALCASSERQRSSFPRRPQGRFPFFPGGRGPEGDCCQDEKEGRQSSSVMTTLPPTALAALFTAAIMYPVDLARALKMAQVTGDKLSTLQLLANFKDTHGYKGFFTQGLVPEVTRAFWMRGLKFFLFPVIHELYAKCTPSQGTPGTRAMAGFLCSIPAVTNIMPLEIAKILLQLDKDKMFGNSMFKALSHAVDRCGWSALFTGYVGVLYVQGTWTAAYFGSLDWFRSLVTSLLAATSIPPSKAQSITCLLSGWCAGVFGAMINTPGDVIRTTIQKRVLQDGADCSMPAGLTGLLTSGPVNFVKEAASLSSGPKGAGALWAGFGFKALHLGGSGALMALFIHLFRCLLRCSYDS
mmetsp:Transcript_17022/g.27691  ORF Transcript_17022/g.27691 Transcript_17022/m.27691 type:complete len:364 (+) Transcript_17022:96-1187(+)